MASLDELMHFLASISNGEHWPDLRRRLDIDVPGWEAIVRDVSNWSTIEAARPEHNHNLSRLYVDTVGAALAVRWFQSSVEDQEGAARDWLRDGDHLDSDGWGVLTEEIKEFVISAAFDRHPGEPFDTWRSLTRSIEHLYHEGPRWRAPSGFSIPGLPVVGYLPSTRIRRLQRIVAGDARFMQAIADMIAQRERSCLLAAASPDPTEICGDLC